MRDAVGSHIGIAQQVLKVWTYRNDLLLIIKWM